MRRPADQAKVLFLYLLRSSSAALATSTTSHYKIAPLHAAAAAASTSSSSSSSSSSTSTTTTTTTTTTTPTSIFQQPDRIELRIARRTDIPSIQRCNLASLPENYSSNFYLSHMRQWPELALVAERFTDDDDDSKKKKTTTVFDPYDPNQDQNQSEIVAYVLGKVEHNVPIRYPPASSSSSTTTKKKQKTTETLAHVTSLAVTSSHRRRGLAQSLMKQLHHHMKWYYDADAVGLNVRVSNEAAKELYGREEMGYVTSDVVGEYYADGEDAYFMRKEFHDDENDENEKGERGGVWSVGGGGVGRIGRTFRWGMRSLSRSRVDMDDDEDLFGGMRFRPNKMDEEYRLPRVIARREVVDVGNKKDEVGVAVVQEDEEEEEQLMSGSV